MGIIYTASSTPGVAMKSTGGPVIGQAMSEYDGVGTGMVVVIKNFDFGQESVLLGDICQSLPQMDVMRFSILIPTIIRRGT